MDAGDPGLASYRKLRLWVGQPPDFQMQGIHIYRALPTPQRGERVPRTNPKPAQQAHPCNELTQLPHRRGRAAMVGW